MMFRRIRRPVGAHRERILSLVLLPAFFLGTLPQTACICADGHREASCPATSGRILAARTNENKCGGHSCCMPKSSASENRTCCQAKLGQPSSCDTASGTTLIAQAGSCCHRIVESPAPVAPSAKSDLVSKSAVVAAIEPIATLWSADRVRPEFERGQHSTPPPIDAVIVYLHLTI